MFKLATLTFKALHTGRPHIFLTSCNIMNLRGLCVHLVGNAEIAGLDIAGLDNGGLDNDGRMCAQATELKLQNVRMTETDALRVVHCY